MKRKIAISEDAGEFVAICRELDIACQGRTEEEERTNLEEVVELFFQTASRSEISARLV